MKRYVDLHLHSKYARATSKDLDITHLETWAKIKGLSVLGTGDFTHPAWFKEITRNTTEDEHGILTAKGGTKFIWQTELSFIYTQGGRGRRVHLVVLAPGRHAVEKINAHMLTRGRLDYDGRPVFGMSCADFTEAMMKIDGRIEVIPAHAWTPWFSVFGSKSGFDSLKECFLDQTKHIHAIETGLSSDPPMNWRVSALDGITLVSNSDAHSFWPWRLGRECNVMDLGELSYDAIISAIRTRKGFSETIEVDPGYGKYHFDGHRDCGVSLSPAESRKLGGICPKCKRPLTIGVQSRVEDLADRPEGFTPTGAVPYRSLLPLSELLSFALHSPVAGKKTWQMFNRLVSEFGSEFAALIDADEKELARITGDGIARLIAQNRRHELKVAPGYDGEYGRIAAEPPAPDTPEKKDASLTGFL